MNKNYRKEKVNKHRHSLDKNENFTGSHVNEEIHVPELLKAKY